MIRRFLLLTQVPVFKNFNIILPSELTAPPEKKGGRITAAVDYHSVPLLSYRKNCCFLRFLSYNLKMVCTWH
jgi:hypothetical protein